MIFNSIEKQIRNFNRSSGKLENKCSINYNQALIPRQKDKQITITHCKRDFEDRNIHFPTSPRQKEVKMLMKSYSAQKLGKNNRKDNYYTQKHQNGNVFIKKGNQLFQFHNRCCPLKYKKSDPIIQKQTTQVNNKKRKEINLGLQNHIDRAEHNKNLEFVRPQLSSPKKQKQNSLSQTNISTGSQLYELSPIHFNKYMAYKDRIANSKYFPSRYHRHKYLDMQRNIEEGPYQLVIEQYVTAQRSSAITVNFVNSQIKKAQGQLSELKDQIQRPYKSEIKPSQSIYNNDDNYIRQKIIEKQASVEQKQQVVDAQHPKFVNPSEDQLTFTRSLQKIDITASNIQRKQSEGSVRPSLYNSTYLWMFVSIVSVLTLVIYQIIR